MTKPKIIPKRNGKTEIIRAIGGVLISLSIVLTIWVLIAFNADSEVANVIAGGLVMALKDAIALFARRPFLHTGPSP